MDKVARIHEPYIPIKRPKRLVDKKLKKGKSKIQKYINNKTKIWKRTQKIKHFHKNYKKRTSLGYKWNTIK